MKKLAIQNLLPMTLVKRLQTLDKVRIGWGLVPALLLFGAGSLRGALTDQLEVYLNFDNNLDAQLGTAIQGAVIPIGREPRYTTGRFGQAAKFLNRNDFNSVSHWAVSLGRLDSIYAGSFSVSLWVRTGNRGGGALTGNRPVDSGDGWIIQAQRTAQFNFRAGTQEGAADLAAFCDGRWHHVVLGFNRDANHAVVYFDGLIIGSPGSIYFPGRARLQTHFRTLIGASGDGAYGGAGEVDDYAIWSRVLTSDEVALVHGAGLKGLNLAQAEQTGAIFKLTSPSPHARQVLPTARIATTILAGSSPINQGSIKMLVDGLEVRPEITSRGNEIEVSYTPPAILAPRSRHTAKVTANDSASPPARLVHEWTFEVASYVALASGLARPFAATAVERGFRCWTVWAQEAQSQILDENMDRARAQLSGRLINPATGSPYGNAALPGPNPDGSWNVDNFINFFDPVLFFYDPGLFPSNSAFPGIPGPGGADHNSFALEARGYLKLKRGYHRFGVHSDDGFELSIGAPAHGLFTSHRIGAFDDGRPARTTLMDFHAPEDGLYHLQLLFTEGGGPAVLEFFSVDLETGRKILINDPSTPEAIEAYRDIAGAPSPAVVRWASPAPSGPPIPITAPIVVELEEGNPPLTADQIRLEIDGVPAAVTLAKSGRVTRMTHQPAAAFDYGSSHSLKLSLTEAGDPKEHAWNFQTQAAPQSPRVTGQWDFERGDLAAGTGSPLQYLDGPHGLTAADTTFGKASDFGLSPLEGGDAKVMRFQGASHPDMGFKLTHGAAPNDGELDTKRWTLILDLLVPNNSYENYIPLAQLDSEANLNGAEFWVIWRSRSSGADFAGTLQRRSSQPLPVAVMGAGSWHRIAYAVDMVDGLLATYADGKSLRLEKIYQTWLIRAFSLGPRLLLFTDDSGASTEVYVNSIQFRNYAMPREEIAALGGPHSAGIPFPNQPPVLAIANDGDHVTLSWPLEASGFLLETSPDLLNPTWTTVDGVMNNSVTIRITSGMAFYRLRK